MEIRPATPEDVPQVLPMVRKIAAFHEAADPAKYSFRADPGDTYRNWLRKRATDPRSVFLVADAPAAGDPEPRLVGFLVGTVEPEIGIYGSRNSGSSTTSGSTSATATRGSPANSSPWRSSGSARSA